VIWEFWFTYYIKRTTDLLGISQKNIACFSLSLISLACGAVFSQQKLCAALFCFYKNLVYGPFHLSAFFSLLIHCFWKWYEFKNSVITTKLFVKNINEYSDMYIYVYIHMHMHIHMHTYTYLLRAIWRQQGRKTRRGIRFVPGLSTPRLEVSMWAFICVCVCACICVCVCICMCTLSTSHFSFVRVCACACLRMSVCARVRILCERVCIGERVRECEREFVCACVLLCRDATTYRGKTSNHCHTRALIL